MRLILVRHGNIFEKDDKIIRLGIEKDLPLTKEGIKQAIHLGESLKNKNIIPEAVYVGESQKCIVTGEKVVEVLGIPKENLVIDKRIDDFDYGNWTGLTDEEIVNKFGQDAIDNWEESVIIPNGSGFSPQENIITYNLRSFCAEVITKFKKRTVLAIASDGVIKFFKKNFKKDFQEKVKDGEKVIVKTGHCVDINIQSINNIKLNAWNIDPAEID